MTVFPEPFSSIVLLLLGLVFGSFLNVCIHRLPEGASVVRPRSSCPECGSPIHWYQNVPVVSWLALGGRCAACRARISLRYPAVELLGGVLLVLLWRMLGPGLAFPIAAFFALAMVVLFFTDFDHQILPDAVTLTGFAVGVAVAWLNPFLDGPGPRRLWLSLAGAALGSGLLWGIGALYGRLRGVEAMGMGDVKMMAMIGAFTGPFGVMTTILFGSIGGAVIGLLMIPLRGRTLQDALPFGCFLAPAAMVSLLYSGAVWSVYARILTPPL
ncbi:MAG TPA: A24 family peptidase [Candidatus Polarisedimenticolaceae bacterium]|nr:A24 family peptidase [Candidatus Polarisedimenticolaceae bacterium]